MLQSPGAPIAFALLDAITLGRKRLRTRKAVGGAWSWKGAGPCGRGTQKSDYKAVATHRGTTTLRGGPRKRAETLIRQARNQEIIHTERDVGLLHSSSSRHTRNESENTPARRSQDFVNEQE